MPLRTLLPLLLLLLSAHAEVVQIQIVHRHGARPHLSKHPRNISRESRPRSLYPAGVAQLQNLASNIRATYMDPSSDLFISALDPDILRTGDIIARSSNLYRTLISSRAFLTELYPGQLIPTLIYDRVRNDWIIRGYSICPKLNDRFEDFLTSEAYQNKKNEKPQGQSESNEQFVIRLANNFQDYKEDDDDRHRLTFSNVWNVYDRYLIIANDGYRSDDWLDDNPELANVDKLSTDELNRLKALADWVETSKFDFANHNIHVAGGLLRMIMRSARGFIHPSDPPTRRFLPHHILEYSAHYPTLLSLLASLRANSSDRKQFPANEVPGFGAALIFELHKVDPEYFMKLKWWKGDGSGEQGADDVSFQYFHISRPPCTDAEKGCNFSEMDRLLAADDLDSDRFCNECESTSDICEAKLATVGGTSGAKEADDQIGCQIGAKVTAGAIGAVAGLVLGLLLALGYLTFHARRKRRGLGMPEDEFDTEGDFDGVFRP